MADTSLETYALRADVHAVCVNGDLVFLDVEQDRYICLPGGEGFSALSPDRRHLTLADRAAADELLGAGLLDPGLAASARGFATSLEGEPPMPRRSALSDRYSLPHAADALAIGVALTDLLLAYRDRTFQQIVGRARRPRRGPPQLSPALVASVARFHRWAPLAPTSAKCLLRSFMLLRLLRRCGHDAFWVFGVRTWPFHAHCWLQCEDMVLDDEPDRIRAFTPIMVV